MSKNEFVPVSKAGVVPLLPIIQCICFKWKVKSFHDITKNTRPSAMAITENCCCGVSDVRK